MTNGYALCPHLVTDERGILCATCDTFHCDRGPCARQHQHGHKDVLDLARESCAKAGFPGIAKVQPDWDYR